MKRYPLLRRHALTASEQRILGVYGFRILGPDAKPAVPDLIKLTENRDKDIRSGSLDALFGTGANKDDFLPVLIRLSADDDRGVWQGAKQPATNRQLERGDEGS